MEHSPATILVGALNGRDDEPCLLREGGDLTYRQVRDRVSQYLHALSAARLRPGSVVALLGNNTPEMVLLMAAMTVSCTTRVPLNARGSLDDHAFVIADAGAQFLVYDAAEFSGRAQALADRHPGLVLAPYGGTGATDLSRTADAYPPQPLTPAIIPAHAPDDLAIIGYTGGTTGRPKGVRSSHRVQAWMTLIQMAEWDWPDTVRAAVLTPLSHSGMVISATAWLRGGAVYVAEGRIDAARFFGIVATQRITTTLVVPTIIYEWLDSPDLASADLSSLQTVFYGSAPIAAPRLAEAIRRIGPVFCQFYGQSEAPMTVCVLRKRDHDPDDLETLSSCGRPVPWVQVSLREDGAEVPPGEPGEICVRGPIVVDGYVNLPDETAAVLRDGWLHTGDIARRLPNGLLRIVDRRKDMVISGGFNVYPKEVEDVLVAHRAVADAAVIGVPDDRWGEAVHAVVVLRPGAAADAGELIAAVKQAKGSIAAPKSVEFVAALPLTAIGKVDKKALRQAHRASR